MSKPKSAGSASAPVDAPAEDTRLGEKIEALRAQLQSSEAGQDEDALRVLELISDRLARHDLNWSQQADGDEVALGRGLEEASRSLGRSADILERSHRTNQEQMSDIRSMSRRIDKALEESRNSIEALVSG